MATWIFILNMVFPISDLPAPGVTTPTAEPEADEVVRYRGLEKLFARFEAEADPK